MATLVRGSEMDEDRFEDRFEALYEDVGDAAGKNGPLPKFNGRKYKNLREMREAVHQIGALLREGLEELRIDERADLKALNVEGNGRLQQIKAVRDGARQAVVRQLNTARRQALQKREQEGAALTRSINSGTDVAVSAARRSEISNEYAATIEKAQKVAEKELKRVRDAGLREAGAIKDEIKRREEAIRKAAEKTRGGLKDRLQAIPAFWQARDEAIEYLERQDDPALEGLLTTGDVMSRSRYLTGPEVEHYVTRAKHPTLGWLNPSYWKGWRLVGVCVIVVLAVAAVVGEAVAFGSIAQGIGLLIGLIILLSPLLARVAVLFRGLGALGHRKK